MQCNKALGGFAHLPSSPGDTLNLGCTNGDESHTAALLLSFARQPCEGDSRTFWVTYRVHMQAPAPHRRRPTCRWWMRAWHRCTAPQ